MQDLSAQIGWCNRMRVMLVGLLIGGLAAFYFLGYRPLADRLAQAQRLTADARQELAANQALALEVPVLSLRVEKLQARIDRYGKKLPRQPELGEFIRDLTQVGQQSSLKGLTVQPLGAKRLDRFFELPICMTFEGDFANAALFLRQIEDLQRLTRVQRLQVRARDPQAGTVAVDVTMNIYFAEGL